MLWACTHTRHRPKVQATNVKEHGVNSGTWKMTSTMLVLSRMSVLPISWWALPLCHRPRIRLTDLNIQGTASIRQHGRNLVFNISIIRCSIIPSLSPLMLVAWTLGDGYCVRAFKVDNGKVEGFILNMKKHCSYMDNLIALWESKVSSHAPLLPQHEPWKVEDPTNCEAQIAPWESNRASSQLHIMSY